MSRSFNRILGLLGVLALMALLQPLPPTLAASGREFSRCVQTCNEARKACDNQCKTDCEALFRGTPNKAARDACIAACKTICGAESDDCKLVCQENRNGHVEEP